MTPSKKSNPTNCDRLIMAHSLITFINFNININTLNIIPCFRNKLVL